MAGAALMLAVSATAVTVAVAMQPGQPRLTVAGVAQDPCQQQRALPVPARLSGATATSDGRRWAAAAARLAAAITATFGQTGYQRNPDAGSGADAAVTFLGPPFAEPGPEVLQAARSAQQALTLPGGGPQPGASWPGTPDLAWTAETAFFALFDAATGQHGQATALLDWLAAHRTQLGSLHEQLNSAGKPAWIAPQSWTDTVTLLAQARHLPTVPIPPPASNPRPTSPEFTAPEMTRRATQACAPDRQIKWRQLTPGTADRRPPTCRCPAAVTGTTRS